MTPPTPVTPTPTRRLSAVVITRNEAPRIARCLQALAFADETVVLDSGSTDETVEIARAAGARVEVSIDWPGFGAQKNRALALARGDWIVLIDADEVVTAQLAQSIRAALAGPPACYALRRISTFLGTEIRWGDWRGDRVERLFPRGQAQFSDLPVHERLQTALPVRTLAGVLLHDTYRSVDDVNAKTERYAALGAQLLHQRGRRVSAAGAAGRAAWAWLRCYVLRAGFLDGSAGLQLAAMQARVTYGKYRLLRQLNRARAG